MKQTLVCFAVKEEMKFFKPVTGSQTLITGMGGRNADLAIRQALANRKPELVLTCGFAGGLHPSLEANAIVFECDPGTRLETVLTSVGARRCSFHFARRVAITPSEKNELWKQTGMDAIEMESQSIHNVCREERVPCATVRVISDTAHESLPLDFNLLMNHQQKLNYGKLGILLLKQPQKIGELMSFQKQTIAAAQHLGEFLNRFIPIVQNQQSI
ncbi:MAG: hypothetical protein SFY81_05280 [Verrucomicrobiota bacterium]|nr:hypothetical protein [Verrucomicrobiota bacterium]